MTLIGSLILQPSLIGSVKVDRSALSKPERIVYKALLEMYLASVYPIDIMSVAAHLHRAGKLNAVGGQQVLAMWMER